MTVIPINGDKPTHADVDSDAKVALRALLERLDAGDYGPIESWIFVFETTSKHNRANVICETRDSGLTISTAVYLLEGAKLEIFRLAKA